MAAAEGNFKWFFLCRCYYLLKRSCVKWLHKIISSKRDVKIPNLQTLFTAKVFDPSPQFCILLNIIRNSLIFKLPNNYTCLLLRRFDLASIWSRTKTSANCAPKLGEASGNEVATICTDWSSVLQRHLVLPWLRETKMRGNVSNPVRQSLLTPCLRPFARDRNRAACTSSVNQ